MRGPTRMNEGKIERDTFRHREAPCIFPSLGNAFFNVIFSLSVWIFEIYLEFYINLNLKLN